MPLDILEMNNHVQTLLTTHNIPRQTNKEFQTRFPGNSLEKNHGAALANGERIIFVGEIQNELDYFAWLHEIGHIVTNDTHHFSEQRFIINRAGLLAENLGDNDLVNKAAQLLKILILQAELEATIWAAKNALEWTNAMDQYSFWAFRSHLNHGVV